MSHSTREWMRRSKGAAAMRIGLFFGAFLLAEAAQATTMVRMSLGEMSQAAKAIARVRCVSNATVWDAGELWTLTTFEVEQTWRGTLPAEITVRLLGGHTARLTSSVSGVPRFRPNEEAILFLEPAQKGAFSVVAWQQGTFRIHRNIRSGEETVTQDTAYFATVDAVRSELAAKGVAAMPVATFLNQVEMALSGASQVTK